MPDISSNDSMQRRRMAMAARNTGHSDFTMMPSTIQQNSHPAFVIDNFAYYWPQHQKEALLVMRSRPFMLLQQQPHGARVYGVFRKQQEQQHNMSVQHAINNRCSGGLSPTRMTRTAKRGSEAIGFDREKLIIDTQLMIYIIQEEGVYCHLLIDHLWPLVRAMLRKRRTIELNSNGIIIIILSDSSNDSCSNSGSIR
eukprot:scaffold1182_cov214-Chaetoceros_neogracile.AAC.1